MKKIFLLLLLTSSTFLFSQEMYKIDYTFTDRNGIEIPSTLFVNNNECAYKLYDTRERGFTDLGENKATFVENDALSKVFYANNITAYHRFPIYQTELIYKDNYTPKLEWQFTQNKKKIGKYDCSMAKLKINGRHYTVWYTFDVPLKYGPLKLYGLPGMVVEATEDKNYLKITFVSLSKTKDLSEFNRYKNYFLDKKAVMDYAAFEKKVVEFEVAARMRVYAAAREYSLKNGGKSGLSFNNDMAADEYIEYPPNLVNELLKLKE